MLALLILLQNLLILLQNFITGELILDNLAKRRDQQRLYQALII
jgi:hypothetical protein